MCNSSMSMQGALAKHNIEPSNQAVRKEDFIKALTEEFHYAPILHCSSDASGSYIDEVRDKSYMLSLTSLAERAQVLFNSEYRTKLLEIGHEPDTELCDHHG